MRIPEGTFARAGTTQIRETSVGTRIETPRLALDVGLFWGIHTVWGTQMRHLKVSHARLEHQVAERLGARAEQSSFPAMDRTSSHKTPLVRMAVYGPLPQRTSTAFSSTVRLRKQ